MRKVSHHMGMPISIDIPNCENDAVFMESWDLLRKIDNQYSPFKPFSEVSKIASGELIIKDASDELRSILQLATRYEHTTNNYFSVYFNGAFNPSGIVKGWAIKQIELLLESHNISHYMINAGGDIACRGGMHTRTWEIEISDPRNPNATIGHVSLDSAAVATSGNYQKGNHIYNPITHNSAQALQSVTVIGPDIIDADVYATSLFAMGHKAITYAATLRNHKCIIVDNNNYIYSI